MDFCAICITYHERRTQPVEADHDALFGVPVTPDAKPILTLLPFDRERRFREEFEEVSDAPHDTPS